MLFSRFHGVSHVLGIYSLFVMLHIPNRLLMLFPIDIYDSLSRTSSVERAPPSIRKLF